jgi:hypothetical protein
LSYESWQAACLGEEAMKVYYRVYLNENDYVDFNSYESARAFADAAGIDYIERVIFPAYNY